MNALPARRGTSRVAIVHYWLVSMRGGERVVEALCDLYPDADIFTHVVDRRVLSEKLASRSLTTSFISRLPCCRRFYKHYLPLMPMALEMLDLSAYDLIISSEAGPAKGVITRPDSLHICYCHSPMRYLWDQWHIYRRGFGLLSRIVTPFLFHKLRIWDVTSSTLVDDFIANSSFVQKRIRKFYKRESTVIHPPVDVDRFTVTPFPTRDYYFYVGQLTSYKRVDIAVEAFTQNGRRLIVAGEGEDAGRLRAIAGASVELIGRQSDEKVRFLMQNCRALIFPAEEDFGIVPVEAMACGRPVIAFAAGGAAETVLDGQTGILFPEQSAESLNCAVTRFEEIEASLDPAEARARACEFGTEVFKSKFRSHVDGLRRGPGGKGVR